MIAAIKRNHTKVVKYLLQNNADPDYLTGFGLKTIEFAILPGFYEIALLLYEKVKSKDLRSHEEYEQLNEEYRYRYVNFPILLESLKAMIPEDNTPDYLTKPKIVLVDPVADPREGWKKWMKRQL